MGDTNEHNLNQAGAGSTPCIDAALQRDLLISQIIDGAGAPPSAAWTEFTKLAGVDASAWRELALAQRDHAALTAAVEREIEVAALVELPEPGSAGQLSYRISRWGGWAVAAVVAISWLGTQFAAIQQSRRADQLANAEQGPGFAQANLFPLASPQDAISAYKQLGEREGTVLGELPDRVIVELRPLETGKGFEVVYLRQFMERANVPELYQGTFDESGKISPLVLPVSQPAPANQKNPKQVN